MEHTTTWGERDATTRFQGFVNGEDLLRSAFELTADPRFDATAFFVADFLDISGHAIDAAPVRDDLAAQAMGARVTNMRYQIVVVTDDDGILAFTDKMRTLYANGGPQIFVFETREAAACWMDEQQPAPFFRDTRY